MKENLSIGIMGYGFVGKSIEFIFKNNFPIKIFDIDPFKNKSFIEEILQCSFIFICVPTPTLENGEQDLSFIYKALENYSKNSIYIIKSTVLPKTTETIKEKYKDIKIVFSPEFLTEKNWKEDSINPERIIIGGEEKLTYEVEDLYRNIFTKTNIFKMSSTEAELIKYMSNSFLATKVSFMNEFKILSDNLSLNWDNIIKGFASDKRIGESHTKVPGPDGKLGYGGTCFPKDNNAIINFAQKNNSPLSVVEAGLKFNKKIRNKKKFLIFTGVGDISNEYESWMTYNSDLYDKACFYFGDNEENSKKIQSNNLVFFTKEKGMIWEKFAKYYENFKDYEYVLIVDSDLYLDPVNLETTFNLNFENKWSASQWSRDSRSSFGYFIDIYKTKFSGVRETNYIEMLFMMIRKDLLKELVLKWKELNLKYSTGIDLILSNIAFNKNYLPFYIIDNFQFYNPSPIDKGFREIDSNTKTSGSERIKDLLEIIKQNPDYWKINLNNKFLCFTKEEKIKKLEDILLKRFLNKPTLKQIEYYSNPNIFWYLDENNLSYRKINSNRSNTYEDKEIKIILTVFNRLDYLEEQLTIISQQSIAKYIDLHILSNNPNIDFSKIIQKFKNILKITFVQLNNELMFLERHKYAFNKNFKFCIFLDDDMYFDNYAIEDLWNKKEEKAFITSFGRIINFKDQHPYRDSFIVWTGPQVELQYGGPGFSVIDCSIYKTLFEDFEKLDFDKQDKAKKIEDVFLSAHILYKNWKIKFSGIPVDMNKWGTDKNGAFWKIMPLKDEFLVFLYRDFYNIIQNSEVYHG